MTGRTATGRSEAMRLRDTQPGAGPADCVRESQPAEGGRESGAPQAGRESGAPQAGRESGAPQAGRETRPADGGRPGHGRVRGLLVAAALLVPFAGIIAVLIVAQPFADAAGGCGGG